MRRHRYAPLRNASTLCFTQPPVRWRSFASTVFEVERSVPMFPGDQRRARVLLDNNRQVHSLMDGAVKMVGSCCIEWSNHLSKCTHNNSLSRHNFIALLPFSRHRVLHTSFYDVLRLNILALFFLSLIHLHERMTTTPASSLNCIVCQSINYGLSCGVTVNIDCRKHLGVFLF
jgi:hypothetical protein